jgi:NitT/TauT family transport system substrate-binding protein
MRLPASTAPTIWLVMLLSAAVTIAACSNDQTPKEKLEKITLALEMNALVTLVFVAQEQGFFRANALQVTIKKYQAGKLATDAILSGIADVATAAEFVLASNSFTRPDIRATGTIAMGDLLYLVARRNSKINRPEDLRGKKIGVTRKSSGEFFLGDFLVEHGIRLSEVQVVDMKPRQLVKNLSTGEIDAILTWNPYAYNAKRTLGDNAISWSAQQEQDVFFLLLTTQPWLEKHPTAMPRLMASLLEAERYVRQNPHKTREFIKNKLGWSKDYTDHQWPRMKFMVKLPQTLLGVLEDQAAWRISNGLSEGKPPEFLNYIHFTCLEKLKPEAVTIIR